MDRRRRLGGGKGEWSGEGGGGGGKTTCRGRQVKLGQSSGFILLHCNSDLVVLCALFLEIQSTDNSQLHTVKIDVKPHICTELTDNY